MAAQEKTVAHGETYSGNLHYADHNTEFSASTNKQKTVLPSGSTTPALKSSLESSDSKSLGSN